MAIGHQHLGGLNIYVERPCLTCWTSLTPINLSLFKLQNNCLWSEPSSCHFYSLSLSPTKPAFTFTMTSVPSSLSFFTPLSALLSITYFRSQLWLHDQPWHSSSHSSRYTAPQFICINCFLQMEHQFHLLGLTNSYLRFKNYLKCHLICEDFFISRSQSKGHEVGGHLLFVGFPSPILPFSPSQFPLRN